MSMGERVPPAALLLPNTSLVVRHVLILILALQSVFLSFCLVVPVLLTGLL